MSYSKRRLKEVVALQKGILGRIETDLGEFGASPRLKYIQEFTNEFRTYDSICDLDEIVEAAASSQVVWIGDYHALTRSREFTAGFLRQLASRKDSNIALGAEVIFARHQKLLDRWRAGTGDFLDKFIWTNGAATGRYRNLFRCKAELDLGDYPRATCAASAPRSEVSRARQTGTTGCPTLVVLFRVIYHRHLPARVGPSH
jgi:uncharacterized iron-regulated protein